MAEYEVGYTIGNAADFREVYRKELERAKINRRTLDSKASLLIPEFSEDLVIYRTNTCLFPNETVKFGNDVKKVLAYEKDSIFDLTPSGAVLGSLTAQIMANAYPFLKKLPERRVIVAVDSGSLRVHLEPVCKDGLAKIGGKDIEFSDCLVNAIWAYIGERV
jgi:hypothetical protein